MEPEMEVERQLKWKHNLHMTDDTEMETYYETIRIKKCTQNSNQVVKMELNIDITIDTDIQTQKLQSNF